MFFIKTLLHWHRVDVFDQIRFLVMWQHEQLTLNSNLKPELESMFSGHIRFRAFFSCGGASTSDDSAPITLHYVSTKMYPHSAMLKMGCNVMFLISVIDQCWSKQSQSMKDAWERRYDLYSGCVIMSGWWLIDLIQISSKPHVIFSWTSQVK